MTRLALDPTNQLATLLKRAEDDLRELKTKQRHSGASGMRGYIVTNTNRWDISGTAMGTTNGGIIIPDYREFEIIFTSSGKQPFPVESTQLDMRFGGEGDQNIPTERADGTWGYQDGTNFARVHRSPSFDKNYSNNETTYRWTFSFEVYGTLTYFIKVYAAGTSNGTIIVRQTLP